MRHLIRHLIVFWIFIFFCIRADASSFGLFPKTRIGARQALYSGEKGKSFAEASLGYGGNVTVFLNGSRLIPYFGFSFNTISGRQTFLDNTTEVSSSFNFYSAATELGFQVYPIERRTKGLNVYFSGVGVVGYNFIALSKSTTLSSIPYSDQAFSAGYVAGVGAEWILSNTSLNRWTMNVEVLYREENATLLKKTFDLSSLIFAVGFGW